VGRCRGADLAPRFGLFFQLFGAFYFADGVLGLFTGSGYLDFGILINGIRDLPLMTRVFAHAPHLGLGGGAS